MTALYPFVPKTFAIDGQTLSYLDEGQGPPIVMLHGNPTWSFYYRNLVLTLRGEFRVIVPDHMGCGLSAKPQEYPYTLANHIANLTKLVDHLRLTDLSLMVHDWGGAIGLGFAGRYPDLIRSLVITNTAAFPVRHQRGLNRVAATRIPLRIRVCRWPLLGALLVRAANGFARPAVSMAVVKRLAPEVAAGYLMPYDSWANRVAIHAFVRDIPISPSHPSWPTLSEVEASLPHLAEKPMLLLWGGRDFCFNDWFYLEWLRRFPKARRRYFPQAGHYLLEDAGEEIEPLAREFFRETS